MAIDYHELAASMVDELQAQGFATSNPFASTEEMSLALAKAIADIINTIVVVGSVSKPEFDCRLKIVKHTTELFDGKIRIGNSATNLLDGRIRIKNTTTNLLDGKVRVEDLITNLLDGKVDIRNYATDLLDGKIKIVEIVFDLLDGKINIKDSEGNLLDGKIEVFDMAYYYPDFDVSSPYLLKNALWVGYDSGEELWKYYKQSDDNRGLTDPGNPTGWTPNGTTIGYFNGDFLSLLPSGTHANNRYLPFTMAQRCDQDDIQVKVGSSWVDKYATRIIDVGSDYTGTTLMDDDVTMQTSSNLDISPYWMAFSQRARASTGMTWFVAAKSAMNAGKKIVTNADWQAAALGTARSSGNGATNGDTWASVTDQDVSLYGLVGMAGNVWEWVSDWIQAGIDWQVSDGEAATPWPVTGGYGADGTWNINGRAHNSVAYADGAPAALIRGVYWAYGTAAGVFALSAHHAPSFWNDYTGFRCVR